METINDLYSIYSDYCGDAGPQRTRDEIQAEFHRRGYSDYRLDGETFLHKIFWDAWAWGEKPNTDWDQCAMWEAAAWRKLSSHK